VILRLIRGRAEPDQVESLRAALRGTRGTTASVPGPARLHLGTRPAADELDLAMVVFWPSAETLALADETDMSPLRAAQRLKLRDLEVAHFEIDETILRNSAQQPIAVRVATGRFSKPGADIEMQDLLRRRAPLIGDEMTEAYVGRRLVGRAVEVTFVSAWRARPADRSLEETFWPDIALRYDEFSVEVYTAVEV
jgi:hypothetical protein